MEDKIKNLKLDDMDEIDELRDLWDNYKSENDYIDQDFIEEWINQEGENLIKSGQGLLTNWFVNLCSDIVNGTDKSLSALGNDGYIFSVNGYKNGGEWVKEEDVFNDFFKVDYEKDILKILDDNPQFLERIQQNKKMEVK